MQIISCAVNEGIVVGGETTITIVEIRAEEVVFDVSRPDGTIEQVSLPCQACEADARTGEPIGLTAHELVAC